MRYFGWIALVAAGCPAPGDAPDTDDTDPPEATVARVVGTAAKGPFVRGSSLSIAEINAQGEPTGRVFPTETTDHEGHFEVTVDFHGPVRLEAQGYYYNEVEGRLSAAPITLRAYGDVGGDTDLHVNVITHLANQRVRARVAAGDTLTEAIAGADADVHTALGLGRSLDIGAANTLDLLSGDNDRSAYLFAVSTVIAQIAKDRAGADPVDGVLTELVNGLAFDLEDGVLDGDSGGPTADDLRARQVSLDDDALEALLAARFEEIGSDATVPDLDRVFDFDLDDVPNATDTDDDDDGVAGVDAGGTDCADRDASRNPTLAEVWYDGIDQDCDGASDYDQDADLHDDVAHGGDDCDDLVATTYAGAADAPYDDVDADCAGDSDHDVDDDGEDAPSGGGADCDDADPTVLPGVDDPPYDGLDQDCDGWSDDDADRDGHDAKATGGDDCDDTVATTYTGAVEVWYDGVDSNCDGASDYDQDGDGDDRQPQGPDCNDRNAAIRPGVADTWYDGVDTNCDGWSDYDADKDGHDAVAHGGDDCADNDDLTYPGAYETCGADRNCDGKLSGCPTPLTSGDADATVTMPGAGYAMTHGDFDDDGQADLVFGGLKYSAVMAVYGPLAAIDSATSQDVRVTGSSFGSSFVAADFDGDGDDDLLSTSSNTTSALIDGPFLVDKSDADASASFATTKIGFTAGSLVYAGGDVDGDGVEDAVIWGRPTTTYGETYLVLAPGDLSGMQDLATGSVVFTHPTIGGKDQNHDYSSADLNDDGYDDSAILLNQNGGLFVVNGSATPASGSLTLATARITSTDATMVGVRGIPDLDNDGDQELLVAAGGGSGSAVYRLDGPIAGQNDIAAIARSRFTATNTGQLSYVGDVRCDGGVSFAARDQNGVYRVWTSVPPGTRPLSDSRWNTEGISAQLVAYVGDLTGDRCDDFAYDVGSSTLRVFDLTTP